MTSTAQPQPVSVHPSELGGTIASLVSEHGAAVTLTSTSAAPVPPIDTMSEPERIRLAAFHSPTRQQEYSIHRNLLRLAAHAAFSNDHADVQIKYLSRRPMVRAPWPAWISLSHTGDAVAIAASRIGAIGVDIERVGRSIDASTLAADTLHPDEFSNLRTAADPRRELMRTWTMKEAYLKATGEGLRGSMSNLLIPNENSANTRNVYSSTATLDGIGYHVGVAILG